MKDRARANFLNRWIAAFKPRLRALLGPRDGIVVRSWPESVLVSRRRDDLIVLTANLWHDWPWRRRLPERLEAFAELVEAEGVDLVLLQEVARWRDMRVDEWLGDRLGMAYAYSPANGHVSSIGFEEGPAILSKFPLRLVHNLQLDSSAIAFVRRKALAAQALTPGGPLWTSSVHLSLMAGANGGQLMQLDRWADERAKSAPVLVGGDFNAPESSARIQAMEGRWRDLFRHLHPSKDGATHAVSWPWGGPLLRQRLDYLFLHHGSQSAEVLEARLIHAEGELKSDHSFVLARLQI